MNRYLTILVMISSLIAAPLLAQTSPKRISVTIDTKATAQEQLDYARTLIAKAAAARDWDQRHLAVANAAGHLTAIEHRWPQNRMAVAEAYVLLAQLYLSSSMPRNAVETVQQALARAPDDHRLYAIAARANERLGDQVAAASSYTSFVEKFDARHGDPAENVGTLSAAAAFFARGKRHDQAAAALRQAAALDGLAPTLRVTLRLRAIEQSALTDDRGAAQRDLSDLRQAHRLALATTLTPAQRELLNVAEAAISRFEQMLEHK